MNTTGKIIEDAANQLNDLVDKHKKLHTEIEYCQYYAPDAELTSLKKQKLRLKDEIELLRTSLQSLATL